LFSWNQQLFWSMRTRKCQGETMNSTPHDQDMSVIPPNPHGEMISSPPVMTEEELIRFLRIPEISHATNHRHVIENLKRNHGLPRIRLCGRTVYLTDSVKAWLEGQVTCGH
jgi:hypothetical protein